MSPEKIKLEFTTFSLKRFLPFNFSIKDLLPYQILVPFPFTKYKAHSGLDHFSDHELQYKSINIPIDKIAKSLAENTEIINELLQYQQLKLKADFDEASPFIQAEALRSIKQRFNEMKKNKGSSN